METLHGMNGLVYAIREQGGTAEEQCIIGIIDDLDRVDELLFKYYGKLKEISYHDIRDSGIEYTKILEVFDHMNTPYRVTIIVESFMLNEI